MPRSCRSAIRSVARLAAFACAFALAAGSARAGEGPAAKSRIADTRSGAAPRVARNAQPPAPPPGRAGLVLEADLPESRPDGTIEGGRVPSLARSTEGLEPRTLPDGSRRVDLRGRFRAYSVVTIAADGTLRMACADGEPAALALARAAAHPAPTPRAARAAFGPAEE